MNVPTLPRLINVMELSYICLTNEKSSLIYGPNYTKIKDIMNENDENQRNQCRQLSSAHSKKFAANKSDV